MEMKTFSAFFIQNMEICYARSKDQGLYAQDHCFQALRAVCAAIEASLLAELVLRE
jgi:hypothetical protein